MSPDLEGLIGELPKVELHVHLEGAIRPRTLLALGKKNRVDLPATEKELERWYEFRNFDDFIEIYLACSRALRAPEDFQMVVRDFIEDQARQRIVYSEVHFTISTHLANGANGEEVADAISEALEEGEAEHGTRVRLIPDIVRNLDFRRADQTLEWALDHRDLVVALGISGSEAAPSAPFREHFRVAEAEGLHRVAHAGEQSGPATIRAAIADCRPERIGHGIAAVADEALLDEVCAAGLPLEVCPTSNVRLGYAKSFAEHPLGTLLESGAELSINSDDPALFATSLSEEYLNVAKTFGLSPGAVRDLATAAVRHSFLPPGDKTALVERIDSIAAGLVG